RPQDIWIFDCPETRRITHVRDRFSLAAMVEIKHDLWIRLAARLDEIRESVPQNDVVDPKKLFGLMIRSQENRIPAVQNRTGNTTLLLFRRGLHEEPAFLRRSNRPRESRREDFRVRSNSRSWNPVRNPIHSNS